MAKIQFKSKLVMVVAAALLLTSGCGDGSSTTGDSARDQAYPDTPTTSTRTAPAGIVLDPSLQSVTGTPAPEEMKALIALQKKIPYPVMVPTQLPGDLRLESELIGSGRAAADPVSYYSFRYIDPGNTSRFITFNQSRANNRELPGYFLYEEEINGVGYQVYWHKTYEYLPGDQAVRVGYVGEAETFVIIWKGQFTDSKGQPQELFYSISTGTWTGLDWYDMRRVLENLKPLSGVGQ